MVVVAERLDRRMELDKAARRMASARWRWPSSGPMDRIIDIRPVVGQREPVAVAVAVEESVAEHAPVDKHPSLCREVGNTLLEQAALVSVDTLVFRFPLVVDWLDMGSRA